MIAPRRYDVSFQYLLKADTESLFELYQMFGIPNFESTDLAAEGDADVDDKIRRLKEEDEGETDKDGGVTDGKDEKANNIASSANYESAVIAMATSALSQATGKYTAFQCVKNYESLSLAMQDAVADKLGAFHMVVNRLQLLDITLPQEFKDAVDATTVAEQEATSLTYQKVSADITAQANIEQAKINAKLTLYQATNTANGILATGEAKAKAIAKQLAEEAATFKVVQNSFETNVWGIGDDEAARQVWSSAKVPRLPRLAPPSASSPLASLRSPPFLTPLHSQLIRRLSETIDHVHLAREPQGHQRWTYGLQRRQAE
mmetsp:Transcript_91612/g.261850  ORF Transcript_91612/g.261850 Transcript_91612/m.261850 type:complete len:318 (+) Transcript_91612:516-1469(+)